MSPQAETTPTTPDQHPVEDLCFFCATDEQLGRGFLGQERRTIHMAGQPENCPRTDPEDFQ